MPSDFTETCPFYQQTRFWRDIVDISIRTQFEQLRIEEKTLIGEKISYIFAGIVTTGAAVILGTSKAGRAKLKSKPSIFLILAGAALEGYAFWSNNKFLKEAGDNLNNMDYVVKYWVDRKRSPNEIYGLTDKSWTLFIKALDSAITEYENLFFS